MSRSSAEVVAQCPNAKCGKPIYSDHTPGWCIECGEPLPENVQEQIPLLRASTLAAEKSIDASGLEKRYGDAYSVARFIVGVGDTVKILGIMVGLVLFFAAFLAKGLFVVLGLVTALVTGSLFYVAGVLVSAQGQVLQASLDTAVNSSPLLDNGQKAQILAPR
jgi:hypothetical protein